MPVVGRRNSLKKKKARTVLVYAQVSSGIAVQRRQRKGNPSKSGGNRHHFEGWEREKEGEGTQNRRYRTCDRRNGQGGFTANTLHV